MESEGFGRLPFLNMWQKHALIKSLKMLNHAKIDESTG